jgi:Uma2 family endonuclease
MATQHAPYRTRRWTRREYGRLLEVGILHEDDPVELVAGRLLVAEPKRPGHSVAVELVAEALRRAFGADWTVRTQAPIALDPISEPEPDVCVVPGAPRDYVTRHPARPPLVVEVSESSLGLDRGLKRRRYARAGIPEYWILNLVDEVLEVHRDPSGPQAGSRATYRTRAVLARGAVVVPRAARAGIAVADLLP